MGQIKNIKLHIVTDIKVTSPVQFNTTDMFEMLSTADPPFLYAVAGVIVLAIASLFGLVLFASREETFEDVVEKQRKAQEALLYSLQQGSGKSGKQNRKWNKLKNKKAAKPKESEEIDHDSGVDEPEVVAIEVATEELNKLKT